MKTKTKFLNCAMALMLILQFTSCEDGEDGAIGPQGPQGEQGSQGEQGIPGEDGMDANSNDVVTMTDVLSPITNEVVGSSTLTRSEDQIMTRFETSMLTPSYAYTLWWLVVNQPENCMTSPCGLADFANPDISVDVLFVSGRVANQSGEAIFTGVLLENDGTTSVNDQLGLPIDVGGLQDTQTAQIHVVLRSHGPAQTGLVDEQISMYTGGCSTLFPPFSEIPDAVGECGDIQVAIHLEL